MGLHRGRQSGGGGCRSTPWRPEEPYARDRGSGCPAPPPAARSRAPSRQARRESLALLVRQVAATDRAVASTPELIGDRLRCRGGVVGARSTGPRGIACHAAQSNKYRQRRLLSPHPGGLNSCRCRHRLACQWAAHHAAADPQQARRGVRGAIAGMVVRPAQRRAGVVVGAPRATARCCPRRGRGRGRLRGRR